jgi:type I restriction enzyme S subunit
MVARSVGVNYPAINATEIGDIHVPLPPRPVQRAIAEFLDREAGQIDTFADRQRVLVDLLNEQIDASIRLQIGKSPLADPRSSDVTSVPIRRILAKLSRPASPEAEMVTAFRDGQVTARSLRRTDGFTESASDDAQVQGVRPEDVVVHGLDGFAGAIGVAEVAGVCSPVYHVCEAIHGTDPAYIARMLRILALGGYLELFTTSTRERAVDLRNWDLFREIPVPSVIVDEQERVGNRIRRMRALERAVARSVTLAKERRQALITAAVTGQLNVLEAT